jgi:hypothetical protein
MCVTILARSVGRGSIGEEAFMDWAVAATLESGIVTGSMRGIEDIVVFVVDVSCRVL